MNHIMITSSVLFAVLVLLSIESRLIKPTAEKHKVTFHHIQILRGLAAVQVLVYHMHYYIYSISKQNTIFDLYEKVMTVGFGAWFFFVISGFIMGYLIHTNYNFFLMRRFLRIYPIYILSAGIVLCLKIGLWGTVSNRGLFSALTLLPGYGQPIDYPLFIEWTLVYEIFFYLICSVFALGNNKRFFLPFVIIWFGVIVVFQIAKGPISPILPDFTNIAISAFNILFICGVISYYLFLAGKKHIYFLFKKRRGTVWSIYTLCFIAMIISIKLIDNVVLLPLIFGLLSGMIIILASVFDSSSDAIKNSLFKKFFVRLGDYSYGIYLIHANFLAIAVSLILKQVSLCYKGKKRMTTQQITT